MKILLSPSLIPRHNHRKSRDLWEEENVFFIPIWVKAIFDVFYSIPVTKIPTLPWIPQLCWKTTYL